MSDDTSKAYHCLLWTWTEIGRIASYVLATAAASVTSADTFTCGHCLTPNILPAQREAYYLVTKGRSVGIFKDAVRDYISSKIFTSSSLS